MVLNRLRVPAVTAGQCAGRKPSLFLLFYVKVMGFYSRKFRPCQEFQFDLDQFDLFFNAKTTSIGLNLSGHACCFYVKGVDFE